MTADTSAASKDAAPVLLDKEAEDDHEATP